MDVGNEDIEFHRYICPLCGENAMTEDDIFWHIDTEHSKEEIIEHCIERKTMSISAEEYQLRL